MNHSIDKSFDSIENDTHLATRQTCFNLIGIFLFHSVFKREVLGFAYLRSLAWPVGLFKFENLYEKLGEIRLYEKKFCR